MYRVLIVDDEPIIVNGIYQILQQAMHLELELYRAYHAYEALERLERTRIDLVVSDIRMPGMDGIELQEKILARCPWCKIVFLTGYNEFDYMQRALRNGGIVDYLLKNEDDELIVQAVEKALRQIEQQERAVERVRRADAKHQSALEVLRHSALLDGGERDAETRRTRFAEAEIPLSADRSVWVMALRYDSELEERGREPLEYACSNIFGEFLQPTCAYVSVQPEPGYNIWAVQPRSHTAEDESSEEAEKAWNNLVSRMPSIAEAAQEACREWLKLPVSLALGGRVCDWGDFGEEARRLCDWLKRSSSCGSELFLQGEAEPSESDGDSMPRMIRVVHEYVAANLDGELSLTRLAELVHHSPTYLSRTYRRLSGATLFEYIADRRMNEAKRLLADGKLKIHEIAAAVGYESAPHFTRFFKKQFGLTPQEYRDRGGDK